MADSAYRGLTIQFGADITQLKQGLKAANSAISQTQRYINTLDKALKFDSTNTKAVALRMEELGTKARATALKMDNLKSQIVLITSNLKSSAEGTAALAEGTQNAALKAAVAKERYANICATIKELKNEFSLLTVGAEELEKKDPFKGIEGTKATLAKMNELLGDMEERTDAAAVAAVKLRNEYRDILSLKWEEAFSSNEIAKQVNQLRKLEVAAVAADAEFKSLNEQFARMATINPTVKATESFRKAATEVKVLKRASESLREEYTKLSGALKIDPTNIELATLKMKNMKEQVLENIERMKQLNVQIKSLEAQGFGKITSSAESLYVALSKNEQELSEVQAKVNKYNAELTALKTNINNLEEGSKLWQKNKVAIEETAAKAKVYEEKLQQIIAKHNELKGETALRKLKTEFAEVSAQASELVTKMSTVKSMFSSMSSALQQFGWSSYATITPIFTMFAYSAINAADDIDAAYRDMRKTVSGTEQQFESLRQAALEFSRTHFTTADTILEIEAMGGQLGIAVENLEEFAETVSNIDIATDLDADTASEQLGQLANILNDMTQNDFENYSNALVRLGNNNATLESKIEDVMLRIASMGTISGFSATQLLAWSTAVAATGQGAEAAGTAVSKTMSDIEAAVGAGGESLEGFAKVAGMSAEDFATAWTTTPSDAMYAFIQGLKNIDEAGGSVDNTLVELGITGVRQKQTLEGLTQTIDTLSSNLTMSEDAWNGVSDAWGNAGDAANEADAKAQGFSGAVQILKNNVQTLGMEMGDALTPAIQELNTWVSRIADGFSGLPDSAKYAIDAMVVLAAALGPVSVGFNAVMNMMKSLGSIMETANNAWSTLVKQTQAETAALKAQVAIAKNAANANDLVTKAYEAELAAAKTLQAQGKKLNATQEAVIATDKKLSTSNDGVTLSFEKELAEAKMVQAQSKQLSATQESVIATEKLLTAQNTKLTVAQNILTASTKLLKAALGGIGVMAVITLITTAADKFADWTEKTALTTNAIEGLKNVTQTAAESMDAAVASAGTLAFSYDDVIEAADNATQSQSDMVDNIRDTWSSAESSSVLVQRYANTILDLMGKENLTKEQQERLAQAVSGFNSETGSSITILDIVNGKISASRDEIEGLTESYKKLSKYNALKSSVEAIEAQIATNQIALDKLKAQIDELNSTTLNDGTFGADNSGTYDNRYSQLWSEYETIKAAIEADEETANAYYNMMGEISDATDGATESTEGLTDALEDAASATDDALEAMKTLIESDSTYSAAVAATGLTVDEFAQRLVDAGIDADTLGQEISDLQTTTQNAFEAITTVSGVTLDTMLQNLTKNANLTQTWASQISQLYAQAGSESEIKFIQYIESMGVEYQPIVESLLTDTTGMLTQLATEYERGGTVAAEGGTNMALAYSDSYTSTMQAQQEAIDAAAAAAAASTTEAIENETPNTQAAMANMIEGIDYELESGTPKIQDTAEDLSQSVEQGLSECDAENEGSKITIAYASGITNSDAVSGVKGAALSVSNTATSQLNNLSNAYTWGAEFTSNYASGILSRKSEVANAASAVADEASAYTHFSQPDKGALRHGTTIWGAELVQNYAKGMKSNLSLIVEQARAIPNAIKQAMDDAQDYANEGVFVQAGYASNLAGLNRNAVLATTSQTIVNNYTIDGMNYSENTEVAQSMKTLFTQISRAKNNYARRQ